MAEFLATRKGLQNLQIHLQQMIEDLRGCVIKMGKSADDDNDLRENPEFMQLRTRATYELPKSIAELENTLRQMTLIEDQPEIIEGKPDYIIPGCMVELESAYGTRIIHILGVGESNPEKGIVSYQTPIGKALLDLMEGDEVTLPYMGKKTVYQVISIAVSPYVNATN